MYELCIACLSFQHLLQDGKFNNVGILMLQTMQTILSDRSPSWAF